MRTLWRCKYISGTYMTTLLTSSSFYLVFFRQIETYFSLIDTCKEDYIWLKLHEGYLVFPVWARRTPYRVFIVLLSEFLSALCLFCLVSLHLSFGLPIFWCLHVISTISSFAFPFTRPNHLSRFSIFLAWYLAYLLVLLFHLPRPQLSVL